MVTTIRRTEEKGQRTPRSMDAYQSKTGVSGAAYCECGAVFSNKRWHFAERGTTPHGEQQVVCPACRRIADRNPAGIVSLKGSFFATHKAEIDNLIKNTAEAAVMKNPLGRIMDISSGKDDRHHYHHRCKTGPEDRSGGFQITWRRTAIYVEPCRESRPDILVPLDVRGCARRHTVCPVLPSAWPTDFITEPPTADFDNLRRYGHGGSCTGCYSHDVLLADAGSLQHDLEEGRDVGICIMNDARAFSPEYTRELAHILGAGMPAVDSTGRQSCPLSCFQIHSCCVFPFKFPHREPSGRSNRLYAP